MIRVIRIVSCFAVSASNGFAQEIQNTMSYRNIGSAHYFRIDYANDLAFQTDYYYTQGVHFELVAPGIGTLPVRYLFPRGTGFQRYGVALESAGYTPTTIFADSILIGDRPFAGMAYVKAFMLSVNEAHRSRLNAVLSLGWMGPAAGGYEIQSTIHRYTGNPDPIGWKHQVSNGLIVNYEIDYERAISPTGRRWLLSGRGMVRAGTLSTKAALGIVLMAGLFDDPFRKPTDIRKFSVLAYLHPEVDAVGYDATLQGPPGARGNPYVIEARDVNRLTFRTRTGVTLGAGRWSVGLNARYLSREFRTGKTHVTAGMQAAVMF